MRHKRTCACALYRPLLGFWVKLKVSKPGRGEERKAQDGQCSGGPITSQPVNMSVFYGYFELYPWGWSCFSSNSCFPIIASPCNIGRYVCIGPGGQRRKVPLNSLFNNSVRPQGMKDCLKVPKFPYLQRPEPHNTHKLCLLTKLVSPEMFQTWNQNGNSRETSSQPFHVWNKTNTGRCSTHKKVARDFSTISALGRCRVAKIPFLE